MNIKRNRILGIALCLLGVCLSVAVNAAKNADVFYTIQTGVRGTGHEAIYEDGHYGYLPHAWGTGSILYDGTPQLGRNDLMIYTITPEENGKAKKVTFQYTPTEDYPYLFIYHCEEVYFGEGGHAPFYVSLRVEQEGNPVGCPSHWTWDKKEDALAQGYVITNSSWGYGAHDDILYSYKGYIPWQVKALDLSDMVGKTITITSEACCCSNQKCRSSMMIAFEKDKKVYGGCDIAIKAPSIVTPEWHKGSKTSPVYSTNNPLNIESASDTYYLVIPGECQDTIEYSVADTCPCLAPVVLMVDTAVEQEKLPYTWHGHIFTGPETYIDTLKNIWGCDSVIYHYSMLAKLTIYADGCDVPNVYWVRPGNDITINANPDSDHKFDRWQDDNRENPRTFTVYGNQTHTVYFAYNRVTLKVYSQGCETPNIYRDIIAGTEVTVYPITNDGGTFLRWSDGKTDNPRVIKVDTDMSVTAIWKTDQCLDPVYGDTTAIICSKELPYMWHGAIAEDGATWTTENSAGCDSIVTLHLIVNEFSTGDTTAIICPDELPYMWHGAIAEDGATWKTENSVGCDSIVTLHLVVNATPEIITLDTMVCDTLMPFTWRGIQFTGNGGEKEEMTYTANGCIKTITTYTLTTTHCERPVTPPVVDCVEKLVYRKWQDVIFCDNGQREFVAFQWYKDEKLMSGETKQYLYMPGGFGQSFYFVEVTDRNGQKRRTCPETFDDTPRSADTYATFAPVRNAARRWKITFSDTTAELLVWDVLGRLYRRETIESEGEIDLPSGVYIVQVKGENGSAKQKIINK
ncbi:MAG: T9SS type A sorting domain-containing protein [Paludibacteraceae bacterium]|nr:T9SS type A sorting domain-containing protein [Paludibacteraceae bacterium]